MPGMNNEAASRQRSLSHQKRTEGFYETGRRERRELINELKSREEHVIAEAVESAIGCHLENENGVLYLQYPQRRLCAFAQTRRAVVREFVELAFEYAGLHRSNT